MSNLNKPLNIQPHLVLGTAGHIDHGKTSLIKAMTGVDTDRLKEEKERGISIELGYAELELPSGTALSVVDVPGHERFIRNMVAGASGIDIFLLVVAADDGVMPQTREHMAIIELLQIPQGVVAITKTDLVDAEMEELVTADVQDFLDETPYAGSPIVAVSSKTGEGIPLLLGVLEDAAARAGQAHAAAGAARLPVDRVFSLKGIGTVVTGTLWSGKICSEDTLQLLPDGLSGRARSVEVHDRPVQCAEAGQRVAINISGIDRSKLERGQMVVKGEGVFSTYMVDARIQLLRGARALKYGAQVRFHHGTADATAKLMFADRDRLEPGQSCYAQVRLKTRIVAARGDHFILRSLTPVTTIGGGFILDPMPHKHGRGEEHQQRLETLERGAPDEVVPLMLAQARPAGLSRHELGARGLVSAHDIERVLSQGKVAVPQPGPGMDVFFTPESVNDFQERALAALREQQEKSPADPTLTPEELARVTGFDPASISFQALLSGVVARGEVAVRERRYALSSAEARLSERQKALLEAIEARLQEAGYSPPGLADLTSQLKADAKDMRLVLKLLSDEGRVVRVKPDLYFSPGAVEQARAGVVAHCEANGQITLAEFRDILEVSRKFAQALLEYFDRAGLTRRIEDYRVLRKKGR